MKIKFYILILASFALFNQSCTRLKYKNLDPSLIPTYIESGNITDLKFSEGKSFSINDNAIGLIDSTSNMDNKKFCIKNSLADAYGNIYIFERNSFPEKFKNDLKTFIGLKSATWTLEKTYELKHDAEVCFDTLNFTIYLREKGNYELYKAIIDGFTVYRYYNKYVKEDYNNFLKYHEYLR